MTDSITRLPIHGLGTAMMHVESYIQQMCGPAKVNIEIDIVDNKGNAYELPLYTIMVRWNKAPHTITINDTNLEDGFRRVLVILEGYKNQIT